MEQQPVTRNCNMIAGRLDRDCLRKMASLMHTLFSTRNPTPRCVLSSGVRTGSPHDNELSECHRRSKSPPPTDALEVNPTESRLHSGVLFSSLLWNALLTMYRLFRIHSVLKFSREGYLCPNGFVIRQRHFKFDDTSVCRLTTGQAVEQNVIDYTEILFGILSVVSKF